MGYMKRLSIELMDAHIDPTGLSLDEAQLALQMYRDSLVKCDCCMHHFPRAYMIPYESTVIYDDLELSGMMCIAAANCLTRMYQEIL
jgi:hypothetical protein